MIFQLNSHTGVPPYLQLVQQVKEDIQLGLLKEGDKLPAVREVVTMITINPNTVVKAYRELEDLGLIEKRPGIGTFVSKRQAGPSASTQSALLDKLRAWMSKAELAGLDDEAIEALVNKALRERENTHDAD